MAQMKLPKGVSDKVWSTALDYAQRGAVALDPTDEDIMTRRQPLFHRLNLDTASTEFKFFDLTSAARYITNLEKGRLQQGRVAVLQGFFFDVFIGRDTAGTAGVSEILGTHEAAAADAADATEIASAYGAQAAKIDVLRHGCIDLWTGTKKLFDEEWGLTRFPMPGQLDVGGPGYSLAGAYPATNNDKLGCLQVNNGLASSGNMYPLVPNPILHELLQVKGRLYIPAALTIPATYKLTAVMGFDAQIFGDANNT